jgi:hypothetical protein
MNVFFVVLLGSTPSRLINLLLPGEPGAQAEVHPVGSIFGKSFRLTSDGYSEFHFYAVNISLGPTSFLGCSLPSRIFHKVIGQLSH